MGTSRQPRIQAGVPTGGQFAPGRAPEPQALGIADDGPAFHLLLPAPEDSAPYQGVPPVPPRPSAEDSELADPHDEDRLADMRLRQKKWHPKHGDGMSPDDFEDGVVWRYKDQLWHPESGANELINDGIAPPSLRGEDPQVVLQEVLRANGFDIEDNDWGADDFPKTVDLCDPNLRDVESVVGPDGKLWTLYRDPADIPPPLAGIDRPHRRTALANYRLSAILDLKNSETDRYQALRDPATQRFPDVSDGAIRVLNQEAAALWSTIPEELRSEAVEAGADLAEVFYRLRQSAAGGDDGLLESRLLKPRKLGRRIHDAIAGTDAQLAAARRSFCIDDDGHLDYR